MPRFIGHILTEEARDLLKSWLTRHADTPYASSIRQLLKPASEQI